MTPNSNSVETFVPCTYPQVSSSYVHSFGSYCVDKQTNKQTDAAENIQRSSLYCDVGYANKSAKSNLGRGPRRGAVAHVRPKDPFGYNGAPQIRSQKYPSPCTDPQTPLPASSLDPSDLRCQTPSGSDPPFFHNALDRQTDRPTDRQIVHG